MNWQELSFTSPYQTAMAIQHELVVGNVREAKHGIMAKRKAEGQMNRKAAISSLSWKQVFEVHYDKDQLTPWP